MESFDFAAKGTESFSLTRKWGQSFNRRNRAFLLIVAAFWAVWAGWLVMCPTRVAAEDQKPAAASPAGESGEKTIEPRGFKSWPSLILESSGFIGIVILLLSIYFLSTVGRMFFELRIPIAMPPEILLRCEEKLQQRDFRGLRYGQRERFVFQPRGDHGHLRVAQRPARGPRVDGAGGRRRDRRNGKENQHVGRHRHARPDDRPVGHVDGDDYELRRDRNPTCK